MTRQGPDDWRLNRGPDQPDSLQGSTRLGHCAWCKAGTVPLELVTFETGSGPGGRAWLCVPCYRERTGAKE